MSEKVSIIIPTYNRSVFVEKTIQSALCQTYKNIEIIVVNDGSTDNTNQVLEKYADRVKIITKENGGTASALNIGIENMTGNWFRWIGDDDLLYETSIENMMSQSLKLLEKDKSLIFYSNYDYIDINGNKIGEKIEPDYNSMNDFDRNVILLNVCYANINTALFHKSVFEKCGKFSSSLITDYEYFLRCCIIYGYKLYLIPIVTIGYRKHEEQLSLKHDLIEKESKIARDNILDRLPISLRKKYLVAVSRYQRNNKPCYIVMRRKIRDVVFKTIPSTKRNEIINWYLKRRGIRKYHDIYIKDENDHKESENKRSHTSTEE